MIELIFLGGTDEIGANSCYVNMEGTGLIVDAGLHPRRRDSTAFPRVDALVNKQSEALLLTHAHTDHIGAIAYLYKQCAQRRIIATRATRDLCHVMLRDNAKLVRREVFADVDKELLAYYTDDFVRFFEASCEGFPYQQKVDIDTLAEDNPIAATFYDAGHILGSASILLENQGRSVLFTGDINFRNQSLIPAATPPRHHVDVLVCECTNGASEHLPQRESESKRLATFINDITTNSGSVLIPAFSLGRTQEILTLLYSLMRKGSIPQMPIYTGGMSRRISRLYDVYTYSVPRIQPGFEMTDIPQIELDYQNLDGGKYLSEPSIVLCSSGMMDTGTTSFKLAQEWIRRPSFGIAFVGYVDEASPGYALLHAEEKKDFLFGGKKARRSCRVEQFRFSAHADRDSLFDFITDVKPKHLFLVHGTPEAAAWIGKKVKEYYPQIKVYLPSVGKSYFV